VVQFDFGVDFSIGSDLATGTGRRVVVRVVASVVILPLRFGEFALVDQVEPDLLHSAFRARPACRFHLLRDGVVFGFLVRQNRGLDRVAKSVVLFAARTTIRHGLTLWRIGQRVTRERPGAKWVSGS